jgi:hypothetical protein
VLVELALAEDALVATSKGAASIAAACVSRRPSNRGRAPSSAGSSVHTRRTVPSGIAASAGSLPAPATERGSVEGRPSVPSHRYRTRGVTGSLASVHATIAVPSCRVASAGSRAAISSSPEIRTAGPRVPDVVTVLAAIAASSLPEGCAHAASQPVGHRPATTGCGSHPGPGSDASSIDSSPEMGTAYRVYARARTDVASNRASAQTTSPAPWRSRATARSFAGASLAPSAVAIRNTCGTHAAEQESPPVALKSSQPSRAGDGPASGHPSPQPVRGEQSKSRQNPFAGLGHGVPSSSSNASQRSHAGVSTSNEKNSSSSSRFDSGSGSSPPW